MTRDRDDDQPDDLLASLANLRTCDVSPRRSSQLRQQCHAMLQPEPPPTRLAWGTDGAPFRRIIIPTLGGAWCLAYLVEIIRCTAAIHRYFGAQ